MAPRILGESPQFVDPTMISENLARAYDERNATYEQLLKELHGPSYRGVAFGRGADEAAANRRSDRARIRAAVAARGLSGGGAEALAMSGLEQGYGEGLLGAFTKAQEFEDERKRATLGSLQGLQREDLALIQALQEGSMSQLEAEQFRSLRNYRNKMGWTESAAGLASAAIAIASLYYGGSAQTKDTSGSELSKTARQNPGYSIGRDVDPSFYNPDTGVDVYGNQGAPLSGGGLGQPSQYSLGLTVPQEANKAYTIGIKRAGGGW